MPRGPPAIFDADWPLVVWMRIEDFQRVSLKTIAEVMPVPFYLDCGEAFG